MHQKISMRVRIESLLIGLLVCIIFPGNSFAQTGAGIPQFRDYAVSNFFVGRAAGVKLDTPSAKKYRTRLRDASKEKADFAGHYRLATWGCGTAYKYGAAVDLRSGNVVFLPATICCWGDVDDKFNPVEYRRDSRLVVLSGQLDEEGINGAHYFELRGDKFTLVSSIARDRRLSRRIRTVANQPRTIRT